jgi:hypothetical protein
MALASIVLTPFMGIGRMMSQKLTDAMAKGGETKEQEADLLCGDSIVNFKTV